MARRRLLGVLRHVPRGRAERPGDAAVHRPHAAADQGGSSRDPANFQATVKRIVDGITNAGAWPNDTPNWVDQRNPKFYLDESPRQQVIIRLEPRPEGLEQ